MDYTKCFQKVLSQYAFTDPVVTFIRHNENITYKITEQRSGKAYLLRMHKPIAKNMEGVQMKREAIRSELEFLLAWGAASELPVQLPVSNRDGELVTSVVMEDQEVHASILNWISGEMTAKSDFASEEGAGALGEQIARLHQFSQTFSAASDFIRPEYGLEWLSGILLKLRSGEQQGVIARKELDVLQSVFGLVQERMERLHQRAETWGFIHADIHYSNLIRTAKGISFIDFGLSGFGYYAMDVAMAVQFTPAASRDALLSGYTAVLSERLDIALLEDLMFLNLCEYYAFLISREDRHAWIREHIPSLMELGKALLRGEPVFYRVNQVGLAN